MANRSGELFVREEGSVCYKSKDRGSTEGKDVSLARFEATDNAPYSIPTHFYPFLWVPLSLVRLAKLHLVSVWSQRLVITYGHNVRPSSRWLWMIRMAWLRSSASRHQAPGLDSRCLRRLLLVITSCPKLKWRCTLTEMLCQICCFVTRLKHLCVNRRERDRGQGRGHQLNPQAPT